MNKRSALIDEQLGKRLTKMEELNRKIPVQGERQIIPLEGRSIPVVFYRASSANRPICFTFHGGGFLFGGCAFDDAMNHSISTHMNVNVVSVGYRKTSECAFPCALNDAYEVIQFFIRNQDISFNREKIVTYGSSAGANIAAAVSILAVRRGDFRVAMQILNYPYVDVATSPRDKGHAPDRIEMIELFNDLYAPESERRDPLVSPLYAEKKEYDSNMAAVMILAENDELRVEGELYVEKLSGYGLDVSTMVAAGQMHAFLEYSFREVEKDPACPEAIKEAARDGSLHRVRDEVMDFIFSEWEKRNI